MSAGVRVTGGAFRGRSLAVPRGARPTEGRVREALFSIWLDRLTGARFLDLFAGSGVVSLEAVGRGALRALAADADPRAVRGLSTAAAGLGTEAAIEVRRLDLPADLHRLASRAPFDLIFADPPYAFEDYAGLLAGCSRLLAAEGEMAIEHSSRRELATPPVPTQPSRQAPAAPQPAGTLTLTGVRRYGESALSFFSWASDASGPRL